MGVKLASVRHGSSVVGGPTLAQQKVDIGSREIVGYGANGEVTYIDSVMAPFPAIRFKEDKGEIAALRRRRPSTAPPSARPWLKLKPPPAKPSQSLAACWWPSPLASGGTSGRSPSSTASCPTASPTMRSR